MISKLDFKIIIGPLSSIQVPADTTNFNMNDLVDQFKSLAARAGFDNTYIDTAVKDIYSSKNGGSDVKDYMKNIKESEKAYDQKKQ